MPGVGYVYDPLFLDHELPGHPERPDRLRSILQHLEESGVLARLRAIAPRDATEADLRFVHTADLIERVRSTAGVRQVWFDADTYAVARSYDAALRAAGGLIAATNAMLDGAIDSAFCFVRPPGHHATPDRAMGFCLFNNVAVAAALALERRDIDRVAIVDFDVHHGNGTQDIFYDDPRVLYFSTHQFPHYPGTGRIEETGTGDGAGTTINVPLPSGCGDEEYLRAYNEVCAPLLRRFRPQMIFVSAGFDAHFADQLAQMLLSTRGYYEIATLLRQLAHELCEGRILYALEGGYDLTAIAWSARACLDTLLGEPFAPDPLGQGPGVRGPDIDAILETVKRTHAL